MCAAFVGGSEAAGPSRRPPSTSLVESWLDVCTHERSTAPASRRFHWPRFAARGHWRRRGRLAVYEIRTLIIARLSLVSSNRSIAHLIREIILLLPLLLLLLLSSSSAAASQAEVKVTPSQRSVAGVHSTVQHCSKLTKPSQSLPCANRGTLTSNSARLSSQSRYSTLDQWLPCFNVIGYWDCPSSK